MTRRVLPPSSAALSISSIRPATDWRILDYKSDQLDRMADVDAELLARYGPQLDQYRAAWERVATGGQVASSDLVALRAKRTIRGN